MYSFSGIDSSGKTTQIEKLASYCIEKNINAKIIWGKGRGTPGVLWLKELLRRDKKMNAEEKNEYRKNVYRNKKKKLMLLIASILDLYWYFGIYYRLLNLKYQILICDRYIWDTYIDFRTEFSEFNIDKWLIWKIAVFLAPVPKESFVFIISAEESYRRDTLKGDLDRDELAVKSKKVAEYMRLVNRKKWNKVIDGTKPIEEIFLIIKEEVFTT